MNGGGNTLNYPTVVEDSTKVKLMITEYLLEFLDETFPERCPSPEHTDRQIWMQVGQRSVVKFLQRIYEEHNENLLESTNVLNKISKDAST